MFLLNKLFMVCATSMSVFTLSAAHAQTWKPEKPVEILVGTTPGGPQDRQGRLLQRIFQERKLFEQTSSVSNKPGGGGAVALAYMSQHKGDAHLLQIVAQPLISNHVAGRGKQHYSDFSPLAILAVEYVALVVRADSPIKDAREFVDNMRKNPAAYSVAIGTVPGNGTHTSYAHAMKAAGVDIKRMRSVAFSSAAEGMTAVMGGHVDAGAGAVSTVIAQVRVPVLANDSNGSLARRVLEREHPLIVQSVKAISEGTIVLSGAQIHWLGILLRVPLSLNQLDQLEEPK